MSRLSITGSDDLDFEMEDTDMGTGVTAGDKSQTQAKSATGDIMEMFCLMMEQQRREAQQNRELMLQQTREIVSRLVPAQPVASQAGVTSQETPVSSRSEGQQSVASEAGCSVAEVGAVQGGGTSLTASASGVDGKVVRGEMRVGGDILEPFDPDDPEANMERWVAKIDQLGEIYGWSDFERAYFAQMKLKGAAKKWFNNLDSYNLAWASWKVELIRAFPKRDEFADRLEELVNRRKMAGESMAAYYHAKLALLNRCKISGTDAVSCIIKGLPVDLQAGAFAARSSTPSDLYSNYLAGIKTYSAAAAATMTSGAVPKRRPVTEVSSRAVAARASGSIKPKMKVVCYNCQEEGEHFSRDCPKPRMERCRTCRKEGHMAVDCPEVRKEAAPAAKRVSLVSITSGQYKKVALTPEGAKVRVYLDTGAERSLITLGCIRRLGLAMKPNHTCLRGFGGFVTNALGEVEIRLTVDGVDLEVKALVTSYELAGAEVFLGQPVWAAQGVALVVRGGRATLYKNETVEEVFRNLTLADTTDAESELPKCVIRVAENMTVCAGEVRPIWVEAEDVGAMEMILFEERAFSENGATLVIYEGGIVGTDYNDILVMNTGTKDIHLKAGRVLMRCHRAMFDDHAHINLVEQSVKNRADFSS